MKEKEEEEVPQKGKLYVSRSHVLFIFRALPPMADYQTTAMIQPYLESIPLGKPFMFIDNIDESFVNNNDMAEGKNSWFRVIYGSVFGVVWNQTIPLGLLLTKVIDRASLRDLKKKKLPDR